MAPVIRIPEDVFKRLQKHAVPFEDTPASVIDRLLTFFDEHSSTPDTAEGVKKARDKTGIGKVNAAYESATEAVRSLGLTPKTTTTPDLRFSKIMKAKIGNSTASDWADLYRLAHRKAFEVLGSIEALQEKVSWEIKKGRMRAKGFEYGYIKEFGFSVRGVDTKAAWERSRELAELCQLSISVAAIGADKKQINLEWIPDETK